MRRNIPIRILAGGLLVTLTALAIAACGGGGGTTATAPTKTTDQVSATVGLANTRLGNILVNSQRRTLYLFKADTGTKSACSGACAVAWPPLLAHGKPTVSGRVNMSLVATAKRSDGTEQVTYNGHPLYLYAGDNNPGNTNGQGITAFGAAWYVLSTAGNQITSQPSSSSSGGSSRGSGASGY